MQDFLVYLVNGHIQKKLFEIPQISIFAIKNAR